MTLITTKQWQHLSNQLATHLLCFEQRLVPCLLCIYRFPGGSRNPRLTAGCSGDAKTPAIVVPFEKMLLQVEGYFFAEHPEDNMSSQNRSMTRYIDTDGGSSSDGASGGRDEYDDVHRKPAASHWARYHWNIMRRKHAKARAQLKKKGKGFNRKNTKHGVERQFFAEQNTDTIPDYDPDNDDFYLYDDYDDFAHHQSTSLPPHDVDNMKLLEVISGIQQFLTDAKTQSNQNDINRILAFGQDIKRDDSFLDTKGLPTNAKTSDITSVASTSSNLSTTSGADANGSTRSSPSTTLSTTSETNASVVKSVSTTLSPGNGTTISLNKNSSETANAVKQKRSLRHANGNYIDNVKSYVDDFINRYGTTRKGRSKIWKLMFMTNKMDNNKRWNGDATAGEVLQNKHFKRQRGKTDNHQSKRVRRQLTSATGVDLSQSQWLIREVGRRLNAISSLIASRTQPLKSPLASRLSASEHVVEPETQPGPLPQAVDAHQLIQIPKVNVSHINWNLGSKRQISSNLSTDVATINVQQGAKTGASTAEEGFAHTPRNIPHWYNPFPVNFGPATSDAARGLRRNVPRRSRMRASKSDRHTRSIPIRSIHKHIEKSTRADTESLGNKGNVQLGKHFKKDMDEDNININFFIKMELDGKPNFRDRTLHRAGKRIPMVKDKGPRIWHFNRRRERDSTSLFPVDDNPDDDDYKSVDNRGMDFKELTTEHSSNLNTEGDNDIVTASRAKRDINGDSDADYDDIWRSIRSVEGDDIEEDGEFENDEEIDEDNEPPSDLDFLDDDDDDDDDGGGDADDADHSGDEDDNTILSRNKQSIFDFDQEGNDDGEGNGDFEPPSDLDEVDDEDYLEGDDAVDDQSDGDGIIERPSDLDDYIDNDDDDDDDDDAIFSRNSRSVDDDDLEWDANFDDRVDDNDDSEPPSDMDDVDIENDNDDNDDDESILSRNKHNIDDDLEAGDNGDNQSNGDDEIEPPSDLDVTDEERFLSRHKLSADDDLDHDDDDDDDGDQADDDDDEPPSYLDEVDDADEFEDSFPSLDDDNLSFDIDDRVKRYTKEDVIKGARRQFPHSQTILHGSYNGRLMIPDAPTRHIKRGKFSRNFGQADKRHSSKLVTRWEFSWSKNNDE